jgi:hypothetical protein
MRENSYSAVIAEQMERVLWNVNNIIECVPEEMWDKVYCEMPLWKHIYHMLVSLDRWYINPRVYKAPAFHEENLNNLDVPTQKKLSKETIRLFMTEVERKIKEYNNNLRDEVLLTKPENCEWTRFILILGQIRHLHSHMGMIMGFIIAETGQWPKVIGLEGEIPIGEYDRFF